MLEGIYSLIENIKEDPTQWRLLLQIDTDNEAHMVWGDCGQRGCYYARVTTSDFQAPGFYQKLGYALYGKLENCPPGETVLYFWKVLM